MFSFFYLYFFLFLFSQVGILKIQNPVVYLDSCIHAVGRTWSWHVEYQSVMVLTDQILLVAPVFAVAVAGAEWEEPRQGVVEDDFVDALVGDGQSVVGFIFIVTANAIVGKIDKDSTLF